MMEAMHSINREISKAGSLCVRNQIVLIVGHNCSKARLASSYPKKVAPFAKGELRKSKLATKESAFEQKLTE